MVGDDEIALARLARKELEMQLNKLTGGRSATKAKHFCKGNWND
jgi:hypothetical protein